MFLTQGKTYNILTTLTILCCLLMPSVCRAESPAVSGDEPVSTDSLYIIKERNTSEDSLTDTASTAALLPDTATAQPDSALCTLHSALPTDSALCTLHSALPKPKKRSFFKRMIDGIVYLYNKASEMDTLYVRPQEYNWSVMLQATTTLESYTMKMEDEGSLTFAPLSRVKFGPYAGWRWLFFGYTFDLKSFSFDSGVNLDFSLYTPIGGVDLVWKQTNGSYNIRKADVKDGDKTYHFRDIEFDGLCTEVKGVSLDYVILHKRFSYTAAFSQSTCQKRGAGSPIVGAGYQYHKLSIDMGKLGASLQRQRSILEGQMGSTDTAPEAGGDTTLISTPISVGSVNLSAGYAYNFVPCRNMLITAMGVLGMAYNIPLSGTEPDGGANRAFSFRNINFNATGRFAIVYNNMRWYAGAAAITRYYSYRLGMFKTAQWNTALYLYIGINFGRRK